VRGGGCNQGLLVRRLFNSDGCKRALYLAD
jgi:hypothetical protein